MLLFCFQTFVWPSFYYVLHTHTVDKEFLIMCRHRNLYILNYIMCTAASIFIEDHMRPQVVHPCSKRWLRSTPIALHNTLFQRCYSYRGI